MIRHFIKAGHRKKNTMNATETRYAEKLGLLKVAGEIKRFDFEVDNLRIGMGVWYKPDFTVINSKNEIEYHEVKGGFITDKGLVKFKVACDLFPERKFKMVQWKNKQWKVIREN